MVDTEVLFAFNPEDRRHRAALARLNELRGAGRRLYAPDTALLEFQVVLRARDVEATQIVAALRAVSGALKENGVQVAPTLHAELLVRQTELENELDLSYFDSLLAASALALDGQILSDDSAFDRVRGLQRIAVSRASRTN